MNVARAFKSKRVADPTWEIVVFVIMSKFADKLVLCSLAMFELVGCAGGGCDEVAKVRVEGVVDKCDEDIWAEAWCMATSAVLMMDDGG